MGERRVRVSDVVFFVVFVAYFAAAVGLLGLGVGAIAAHLSPGLHDALHVRGLEVGWTARAAVRIADASHDLATWWTIVLDYVFSIFNFALAIFLIWLRPRDRTARLLVLGMVGTAAIFNLQAQSVFDALPALPNESMAQAAFHIFAGLAYVYALLLFPDGRPVPRWRLPALLVLYLPITMAAVFVSLRVEGTARPTTLILFFGIVTPIAGVAAQGYRFERSPTAEEHQQARVLFWGLLPALALGLVFVAIRGTAAGGAEFAGRGISQLDVVLFRLFQPVFAIIPIALFVGLLRFRLWDVDRVINRTLVYGILTAILGGAYLGIVVLLQFLFRPLTSGSDIAVAGSTLLVAATARPARSWIQRGVDRRFYRSRYDARRTLEAFSERLQHEIDLDTLSGEIVSVVRRTMQPAHISIALISSKDRGSP